MNELNQNNKVKGVVDIVFLLDVTGSMQHCIDALKTNISSFIDMLTTKGINNDSPVKNWRAKVVGYRDWKHDKEYFVDNPFVEDSAVLKQQLNGLKAEGGGDEPESLLEALFKVANMESTEKDAQPEPSKWRYRREAARVVVAFTDATFHPVMEEPKGGKVEDVITTLHANRILLSLYAPDMDCHADLSAADKSEYRPIPYDTSSDTGAQEALADFTKDQANFKKTMEMLAKSVSASSHTDIL